MNLKYIPLGLLYLLFSAHAFAADEKSLRDKMGEEVFNEAGLEKLSPEELAVLEAWISGDYSRQVEEETLAEYMPKGEKAFGYEEVKTRKPKPEPFREPDRIQTRIEGEFKGWDGDEIFLLENGQVWRQTDNDKFYMPLDSPEVTIQKGMFGSYFLSVEGFGSRCKVRRVR